jgi:hypothetical protein
MHIGKALFRSNIYEVIDCEQCGFSHCTPVPSQEVLGQIYSEENYVKDKPLYISRYLEDREWWEETYAQRF